jgi:integrase
VASLRRAKFLEKKDAVKVLQYIRTNSHKVERDEVAFLLTTKAGLRASEVAQLTWDHVTDAQGKIANAITITANISKSNRLRVVPMNTELREALLRLQKVSGGTPRVIMFRGSSRNPSHALVMWFKRLYTSVGLKGASSHSGRRTFITTMARTMNTHGCSLVDIQRLAGHARINTTESYMEPQPNVISLVENV